MKTSSLLIVSLLLLGQSVFATVYSDLYLENRTPYSGSAMWDREKSVEAMTKKFGAGTTQKIGSFPLPNQKLNQDDPQGNLYLYFDELGYLAQIECFGSGLGGGAGAGARVDQDPKFYTERDSAVPGISMVYKNVETKQGKVRVLIQVYPFDGKSDVRIILEKI